MNNRILLLLLGLLICMMPTSEVLAELKVIKSKYKFGIVNTSTGEYVFPPSEYDDMKIWHTEGGKIYILVKKRGKSGLLDVEGNIIINIDYAGIRKDDIGFTPIVEERHKNGIWFLRGLVDYDGNRILSEKYSEIFFSKIDGLYIVNIKGKYGLVGRGDKIIVPVEYNHIKNVTMVEKNKGYFSTLIGLKEERVEFDYIHEKYADNTCSIGIERYKNDIGYRFKKNGKDITPIGFEDAFDFKNGYARIKKDGKWGFLSCDGKIVIEPKYNYVWDFDGEKAKVRLDDGNTKFIDINGQLIEYK